MSKFDTEYTNELLCPYCQHPFAGAWELPYDNGEVECGECEKDFRYTRHIVIKYSTFKLEDGNDEQD